MATKLGLKSIIRELDSYFIRGRPAVIKVTAEGVYIKRAKERWTTAYLVPWAAVYSTGGKMRLAERNKEKKQRRLVKRGLL